MLVFVRGAKVHKVHPETDRIFGEEDQGTEEQVGGKADGEGGERVEGVEVGAVLENGGEGTSEV